MTIRIRIAALAGAIALACSAGAQQAPDQDQYPSGQFENVAGDSSTSVVDPPSRVARLGNLSGEVSFAPAGESEWSRAQRNRPMVTGDKLYTDANGRAELQVGASTIHVDQHTSMDFLNLNDQTAQVELTQGSLNLDVRRLRSGEVYEVDTPTIAFVADRAGDYRIDVDPNGQATTVSIRRGSGDAIGEGGKRVRIEEGQSIVFNDAQLNDYRNLAQRRNDSFDTYTTQRAERYDRGASRNYVSEDVVGYEDLDDNGTWEDAPDYGHVWYPTHVAADWAPYHDGNWDWVEPYGWTWVDNASWGFAPFHYGRWAYVGSRWGWVPGPVDVRPVYAPALVAFVGGGGFGIDVSIGGPIGWFALGPRDVYFPGYRCGRGYFNNVNISNTVVNNTVINNYYGAFRAGNVNYAQITYANRMAPRAMTAVSATAFTSGRPVATSAIAVNRSMLANARVLPRATIAPTAASLVASRGRGSAPPAAVMNRSVVAAHRPAAEPTAFAQRQALLRKNPGQPLTTAQMRTVATRTNVRDPAMTRSNVRVVGTGAAASAISAHANTRATASVPNARMASQTASAANVSRNSPRANTSNAQLRSSGFAHQGTAPMAPANVHAQAAMNAHNKAAGGTAATTAQTRTQFQSSRFAQQTRSATTEQSRHTTAAATTHPESMTAHARDNSNVSTSHERRSTYAAQNQNRANAQALQTGRTQASGNERAQYRAPQSTAHVNEHVQTQHHAPPLPAREQPRVQAQQYRAPQPAASRVIERQHAQAQYRAPQSSGEQPKAQAQQYRAPQSAHVSEPARAQAQYREPPHLSGQREQVPQRHAQRKDEKRDQNGGGG